ncbi:hypothetical protein WN48_11055 [Eufriesea mexicana]|nr:hypothetical protein WN48_11055 [Eufriesea mexicana]
MGLGRIPWLYPRVYSLEEESGRESCAQIFDRETLLIRCERGNGGFFARSNKIS